MSTQGSDTGINFQKNQGFSKILEDRQGAFYLCKVLKCPDLGNKKLHFVGNGVNVVSFSQKIKNFKVFNLSELQLDLNFEHDLKHWNLNEIDEDFFESLKQVFSIEK